MRAGRRYRGTEVLPPVALNYDMLDVRCYHVNIDLSYIFRSSLKANSVKRRRLNVF